MTQNDSAMRACAGTRPLYQIARDIREHWLNVYFGAVPYLQAMGYLDKITDHFGADDADSIVRYFLGNATYWRGPDARRVKAELNGILEAAR